MSFHATFRGFAACLVLLVLGVFGCAIAVAHTAHAASASVRCTTGRTVIWLDTQGDAGAGSVFYSLSSRTSRITLALSPAFQASPPSISRAISLDAPALGTRRPSRPCRSPVGRRQRLPSGLLRRSTSRRLLASRSTQPGCACIRPARPPRRSSHSHSRHARGAAGLPQRQGRVVMRAVRSSAGRDGGLARTRRGRRSYSRASGPAAMLTRSGTTPQTGTFSPFHQSIVS